MWMIMLVSRLCPFLLKILMEDVLVPQLCSWCFRVSNSISLWILQPLNWQILSTFQEWFGQTQTCNPLPFVWYWQYLLPQSSLVLNKQLNLSLFELMISNLHQYWQYLPSSSLVLNLLLEISSSTVDYYSLTLFLFCVVVTMMLFACLNPRLTHLQIHYLWLVILAPFCSLDPPHIHVQELDISCLFNPYSGESPYTRD